MSDFDDELLSAYLDDELSVDERAAVERLLAERPEARRLLDELRSLREGLQALPSLKLGDDFGAAVLRRAEREMLRATPPSEPPASAVAAMPVTPRRDEAPPHVDFQRWRRPMAWSILAVAAALALMFVDDQRREVGREVAMKTNSSSASSEVSKQMDALGRTVASATGEAEGRTRKADEFGFAAGPVAKNGPAQPVEAAKPATALAKSAAPAAPTAAAPAPPPSAAPAGQFSVMNRAPDGILSGGGNAVGGASPLPGGAAQGNFSVHNTLPTGTASLNSAAAGYGGGTAPPIAGLPGAMSYNAVIDTVPLVAQHDYQRAQTLIAEYDSLRLQVSDAKSASQVAARGLQQLQRPNADAANQAQAREVANKQLLVVYCDVTREALDGGVASILQHEKIADLTSLQQSQALDENTLGLEPKLQTDRKREAKEEYLYVVANAEQMQATLDALRRDARHFVSVEVEPAPANVEQQAWRSTYSRGNRADGDRETQAVPKSKTDAASSTLGGAAPKPAGEKGADKGNADDRVAGGEQKKLESNLVQQPALRQQQNYYAQDVNRPLSRAQRLSEETVDAARREAGGKAQQRSAGAGGLSVAQSATPAEAAPQRKEPLLSDAPVPPAVSAPVAAAASPTTPTPAAAPASPAATTAAKADAKPGQSASAKDGQGTAAADRGQAGAAKQADDAFEKLGEAVGAKAAFLLPPDYHEALFIFRVVDDGEKK